MKTIHMLCLLVVCFLAYSNSFNHAYNLDDNQLILVNPYVRSLSFIPKYFSEANTYSTVHLGGYRPMVQVTYALNYAISGYNTWSWHLVQVLLHIVCVLCIYLLACKFFPTTPWPPFNPSNWFPLIFAAIFALNPVNSGVVNYFSARSSLMVAALLLPSFLLYMNRRYLWALLLFTLALFTKEEAVAGLAVFFLYELWAASDDEEGFAVGLIGMVFSGRVFKLFPYFMACVVFLGCKLNIEGKYFELGRKMFSPQDQSPWSYFFTQITAWWHYVYTWFVPVGLIADNQVYPAYGSLLQPEVLLAILGWCLVALVLAVAYKKHSYLTFLVVSAGCLVSPSSSFFRLGEMVNEMRPYLPATLFALAVFIPVVKWFEEPVKHSRLIKWASVSCIIGLLSCLFVMTYNRNVVFKTCDNYTCDVIRKAPASPRSLNNLALSYMSVAQYPGAIKYLTDCLRYAPYWAVPHVNLAIVYNALGNKPMAKYYFDRAVELDTYSAVSLFWRAEWHLKNKEYELALADYEKGIELSPSKDKWNEGIRKASKGLKEKK